MRYFHNFNTTTWEIFASNLLLFFCCLFYLVWWIITFNPNSTGGTSGTIFIMIAFITGIAAIILMSGGINTLSQYSKSLPVKLILVGSTFLFILLLMITVDVFHRAATSELLIIHIWEALELSVINVLFGTMHFTLGRVKILVVLVGIAYLASLICYVLYDRINVMASYWDGMIPLIMAALVTAVFLGVLAVS